MVYNSLETLYKKWGPVDRDDMSKSELIDYITDLFDTYEKTGFRKRFTSQGTGLKEYDRLKFKVICRVPLHNCELDFAPLWKIKLETGETMAAYPEEICLAEYPEEQET